MCCSKVFQLIAASLATRDDVVNSGGKVVVNMIVSSDSKLTDLTRPGVPLEHLHANPGKHGLLRGEAPFPPLAAQHFYFGNARTRNRDTGSTVPMSRDDLDNNSYELQRT